MNQVNQMSCDKCGRPVSDGNVLYIEGANCKGCAVSATVKDIFKKIVIPVALAGFFMFMAYWPLKDQVSGLHLFAQMLFFAGIPFGIQKMWLILLPTGRSSIQGALFILIIDVLIGGVIGAFILLYRAVIAVYTLIVSIVRFVRIAAL